MTTMSAIVTRKFKVILTSMMHFVHDPRKLESCQLLHLSPVIPSIPTDWSYLKRGLGKTVYFTVFDFVMTKFVL